MEREKSEPREHGGERIKTAREILEERLVSVKPDDGAADALRQAAEKAPESGAAPAAATPAAESPEIAELRKKAAERDDLYDQLLRVRAEFDNYQKRTRREMTEYRDFALAGVLNDVLLGLDMLDLALAAPAASKDAEVLKQGVELARAQLEKIITDRGATRIPTEGAFDPHRHEAVVVEERTDLPPGTITGEVRRGYMFKDRVIRAAQVKVSKQPEKPA